MYPNGGLINASAAGQGFMADLTAGGLTLGQYLRYQITNPTASPIVVRLYNFSAQSNSSNTLKVIRDATTTITANTITPVNMSFSSTNTSSAVLAYDSNSSPVSGGSLLRTVPLNSSWQEFSEDYLWIPAGSNLVFQCQALLAENFIIHLSWTEE